MVDRASVDCTLYNTNTNIGTAHNSDETFENNLKKSLEENSIGNSHSHKNSPIIIPEQKFQFFARDELGRFPIELDGKCRNGRGFY